MDDWTLDDLLTMADTIGQRIENGRLPAQDEFGRYIFTDADLAVG